GNSALMDPMLVFTMRRIADVGPALAIGDERVVRPGHCAGAGADVVAVTRPRRTDRRVNEVTAERLQRRFRRPLNRNIGRELPAGRLRAAAVVLHEEDKRIVEPAGALQFRYDSSDSL